MDEKARQEWIKAFNETVHNIKPGDLTKAIIEGAKQFDAVQAAKWQNPLEDEKPPLCIDCEFCEPSFHYYDNYQPARCFRPKLPSYIEHEEIKEVACYLERYGPPPSCGPTGIFWKAKK